MDGGRVVLARLLLYLRYGSNLTFFFFSFPASHSSLSPGVRLTDLKCSELEAWQKRCTSRETEAASTEPDVYVKSRAESGACCGALCESSTLSELLTSDWLSFLPLASPTLSGFNARDIVRLLSRSSLHLVVCRPSSLPPACCSAVVSVLTRFNQTRSLTSLLSPPKLIVAPPAFD